MFIVVSKQCGCKPFQNHDHSNCRIYQAQKKLQTEMDKYIANFRAAIKKEKEGK
jgi:hypothetical protein